MAVPVASGGQVLGAVRITFPTDELDADIRRYWFLLAGVTLVGIAAVGAIGLVLARTMTNPLQRLRQSAVSLGRGELSTRVGEGPGPREVQDLAGSFDAMAGRLERLVASQRDFAADASHQLRTPLAALRLRLENLRDGDGADGRRDIDAALVEVERLSGIIDGLLVLARAESTEPPLDEIAVGEVVADRVAAHEALAVRQGVTLSPDAEPVSALAVPGAVDQMLDNLIDNAVKASPRGSTVTVRAAAGRRRGGGPRGRPGAGAERRGAPPRLRPLLAQRGDRPRRLGPGARHRRPAGARPRAGRPSCARPTAAAPTRSSRCPRRPRATPSAPPPQLPPEVGDRRAPRRVRIAGSGRWPRRGSAGSRRRARTGAAVRSGWSSSNGMAPVAAS